MRARSQHARTSPAWARTVAATSLGFTDPGAGDGSAGAGAAATNEAARLGGGEGAGAGGETGAAAGGGAGASGCAMATGAEGASCVSGVVSVCDARDFLDRCAKRRFAARGATGLSGSDLAVGEGGEGFGTADEAPRGSSARAAGPAAGLTA